MNCPDCGKKLSDDKTAYRNHLYYECPLYLVDGQDIRTLEASEWKQEPSSSD